ncbi:MAG: DDE-type integrase/transposase/recombinase [Porticoccaceae bacterium]
MDNLLSGFIGSFIGVAFSFLIYWHAQKSKRQPKETVLVHSDQESQYGSADYLSFLRENNLKPSMSRRGNCHESLPHEVLWVQCSG